MAPSPKLKNWREVSSWVLWHSPSLFLFYAGSTTEGIVKSVGGLKLGKLADTGDGIKMKTLTTSSKGQTETNVVKFNRNKTVHEYKNTMWPYFVIPFIWISKTSFVFAKLVYGASIRVAVTSRVSGRRLMGMGIRELSRVKAMFYIMIVVLVAGVYSLLGRIHWHLRSVHIVVQNHNSIITILKSVV